MKIEAMNDTINAMEVANPLTMLSAYLITAATNIPPAACMIITAHTIGVYPKKNPLSKIIYPSLKAMYKEDTIPPKKLN